MEEVELSKYKGKFVRIVEEGKERPQQIAFLSSIAYSDDLEFAYLDKRYGMILNEHHDTYDAEFSPCKIQSIEEYSLDTDSDGYLAAIKHHIDSIKKNKQSLSFEIPNELKEIFGYKGDAYKSAEEYLRELGNNGK